ncbi:hypothetical protein FKP32DRAFT_1681708 [Trametes sanguinea]|nr:hypothetical protein FKP32DRAFT_1681708 [Trametes sanguinea]
MRTTRASARDHSLPTLATDGPPSASGNTVTNGTAVPLQPQAPPLNTVTNGTAVPLQPHTIPRNAVTTAAPVPLLTPALDPVTNGTAVPLEPQAPPEVGHGHQDHSSVATQPTVVRAPPSSDDSGCTPRTPGAAPAVQGSAGGRAEMQVSRASSTTLSSASPAPEYFDLPVRPASTPSPLTSPSHVNQLAQKVEVIRQDRAFRDGYLGLDVSIRSAVAWVRDGRSNVLVSASDAAALAEARAAYATNPDGLSDGGCPVPKVFTLLGTIAEDNFFMRSDGNYGLGGFEKKFAATSLACALVSPSARYTTSAADFRMAIANVDAFIAMDKTGNADSNNAHRSGRSEENPPVIDDDEVGKDTAKDSCVVAGMDVNDPSYAEFSINGWPTHGNSMAAAALKDMEKSYSVVPLNAYDVSGNLIPPSRYHIELRGATVVVAFTLRHYNIYDRNRSQKDVYCFDIDYVRVLVPGNSVAAGNGKRTLQARDPWDKGKRVRVV